MPSLRWGDNMKPEKIKMTEGVTHNRWISGYNKAIDDYETWLKEAMSNGIDDLAEAISKSIIGK